MESNFSRKLMHTKFFPPKGDFQKRLNYLKVKRVFNKEASVFASMLMGNDLKHRIAHHSIKKYTFKYASKISSEARSLQYYSRVSPSIQYLELTTNESSLNFQKKFYYFNITTLKAMKNLKELDRL